MAESLEVYPDSSALTAAAARQFATLAATAIGQRGVFHVALAGGSTPKRLYHLLAENPGGAYAIAWKQVQVWFGDERHVPPDHPDSNYRMAREALLDHVPLPGANIHRIETELQDAAEAARRYEAALRQAFPEAAKGGFPRLDLVLLGMGPDGHTASLFPGSAALEERRRWVAENWVEKFNTWRVTMTYPVLNAARQVSLFVAGEEKAEMIQDVLETSRGTGKYPVQAVRPAEGALTWMLDEGAAAQLASPSLKSA